METNNVNELKKIILKQEENILQKEENILQKDKKIFQKDKKISHLEEIILYLRRKKFAPSSEKDSRQLSLFNEVEDIVEADPRKEEEEEITYKRKKKTGRRGISDDLPRVDELFDLSEKEKIGMKYIREEISEKLEITPMKIFVRRIIRKKYVKEGDLKSEFKIAPLPSQILPKTMASSSLLSHIIISKYYDALPLYRQVSILKRASGELTRQTMARWLIQVSEKLIPLYNLLQEKLLDSNYLQMDETTVQVLKEDGKRATSKSYMWVRLRPGDCPIILYDYDPTRRGSVPLELLLGFKGYLQCDGYDGYSPACNKYGLKRVGCWDHARRKFFDAFKSSNGKGVGKKGLDYIKKFTK